MKRFHAHDWPGNVRELENLVRRLVVLKDPETVLGELPSSPQGHAQEAPPADLVKAQSDDTATSLLARLLGALPEDAPLKEVGKHAARLAERDAILLALRKTGWNKRKAAARLQISYKAVLYKIRDCAIVDPRDSARAN